MKSTLCNCVHHVHQPEIASPTTAHRLSVVRFAKALEITQGHYSKVMASRVALSVRLAERMESWLAEGSRTTLGDDATRRIHLLAASIRRECMELMHLVGLAEGADL